MNRALALALFAILTVNSIAPAVATEKSQAVLDDFKRHQDKKKKHHAKKKPQKIERVPMAKLKNCHQRRVWVAPNRIREAKVCEVVK